MTADAVEQIRAALEPFTDRELAAFLESDERIREWLGSGVLLSPQEAADRMQVERPRIWRYAKRGMITPVAETGASPLYLRCDIDAAKSQIVRKPVAPTAKPKAGVRRQVKKPAVKRARKRVAK